MPRVDVTSKGRKIPRSKRVNQEPCDPEPKARRTPYQRRKMLGEPIAAIFEIEFEPFGRKYRGAAARPALLARKRQRGVLAQKEAANPARCFAGNPKPRDVAANEEGRDRIADDAGIQSFEFD